MSILEQKTRWALDYKLAKKLIFLLSNSSVTFVISVIYDHVRNWQKWQFCHSIAVYILLVLTKSFFLPVNRSSKRRRGNCVNKSVVFMRFLHVLMISLKMLLQRKNTLDLIKTCYYLPGFLALLTILMFKILLTGLITVIPKRLPLIFLVFSLICLPRTAWFARALLCSAELIR